MKIAYITAGAGHMYCGSCLRDNTLAAALMAAGHQVLLIPTYTPTRTDEPNVSQRRVFLGGINVFLQQRLALFRKTPWVMDRVLDFPPLLRLATRWGVSVDPAQLGAMTVSMLQGPDGFQRKEIEKLVQFLTDEFRPDIVTLPNSMLAGLAPAIKARLNVPICCTLQGEELFLDSLGEPYRSRAMQLIREHAGCIDAFVAVSQFGRSMMAEYFGIDAGRIQVVPMGISFDGYQPRDRDEGGPFTIGYLARVAPEKGLHVLADAYRRLQTAPGIGPSRLVAAGYLGPEHQGYLAGIKADIDQAGLSGQFEYCGEPDRSSKLAFLRQLDVFSVPGPYADPKGLFLLEAMATGVPVVAPRRGAATEIVEATGGGILVDRDSPAAVADGIRALWRDRDLRRECASKGFEGVRAQYSTGAMVSAALAVYRSALGEAGGR
ncbi:MAG: glycosyltransferase family 4 protein [Acidobacteriota bacterium]